MLLLDVIWGAVGNIGGAVSNVISSTYVGLGQVGTQIVEAVSMVGKSVGL